MLWSYIRHRVIVRHTSNTPQNDVGHSSGAPSADFGKDFVALDLEFSGLFEDKQQGPQSLKAAGYG